MDTLSKVLDTLRFKGSFYFTTRSKAPWGIEVPQYQNVARFHIAKSGSCWVRIEGAPEPILLSSGDVIVIPNGSSHVLCDLPSTPVQSLENVIEQTGYSGEGLFEYGGNDDTRQSELVCGHFEFDTNFIHPLISQLPNFILIKEKEVLERSWLKEAMRLLAYEAQNAKAGSEAMIKRLSEIMFIQILKVWNELHEKPQSFMAALADAQISKGLQAFHLDYSANWTVEKMAHAAGMSRTLFSEKFKALMDISPMQYATLWRMQNAQRLLVSSDFSMIQIAEQVGYESVAAFSKAFKRVTNNNPGEYRRQNQSSV